MKPNATIEERIWALAVCDALNLQEMELKDAADFLTHFNGYPTDEAEIEQCERETFIGTNDEGTAYCVFGIDDVDCASEDRAYLRFCLRYNEVQESLYIKKGDHNGKD